MRENFDRAFREVLRSEGGYVNDNDDRGGETNLGVTRASWSAYLKRDINDGEMRGLTVDMVRPFYRQRYWDAVRADELPAGLDYAVFDFAVNAGPVRAIRYLQRAVGVAEDGVIGPATLTAAATANPTQVLERFSDAKEGFYRGLATRVPSQAKFLRGWLSRVQLVEATAATMVA